MLFDYNIDFDILSIDLLLLNHCIGQLLDTHLGI